MAQKAPQPPDKSSSAQTQASQAKRPPLPKAMPVQYYETIQKSLHGHQIPTVHRQDDRPRD